MLEQKLPDVWSLGIEKFVKKLDNHVLVIGREPRRKVRISHTAMAQDDRGTRFVHLRRALKISMPTPKTIKANPAMTIQAMDLSVAFFIAVN